MKILYHHRTASKDGQAVHIEEMVAALRELGHEVCVVGPEQQAEAGQMGKDADWVHRLKSSLPKSIYELLELGYSLLAYLRLRRAAKVFRPDFIYERYNLYLCAGLMLSRRLGIPLILEVNAPLADERARHSGGLALPWLAHWIESLVWRNATFVLPVTRVLGGYLETAGVEPHRIHVMPNGINETHFLGVDDPATAKHRLGIDGKLVLGFTGFVRDWHGVDRVVRWLASPFAPSNSMLLVVGDGPVRAELEGLAKSLGIGERVRFTGVIDRDLVPAHVASFDIALQPAVTSYASPLKLMEYLVLAKPVVAPRTPNLQEVLEDEVNALLFDEATMDGLEQALTRLSTDAALRERIGVSGRQLIQQKQLTWLGNARRVLALAASA
ncbi:MAG: glycosyltransferase family 4 protein [Paucibacter sp.]|nr:glycosyltransferase family 4 protein [Roseateles sp.]